MLIDFFLRFEENIFKIINSRIHHDDKFSNKKFCYAESYKNLKFLEDAPKYFVFLLYNKGTDGQLYILNVLLASQAQQNRDNLV
jgi:hypothetical protein